MLRRLKRVCAFYGVAPQFAARIVEHAGEHAARGGAVGPFHPFVSQAPGARMMARVLDELFQGGDGQRPAGGQFARGDGIDGCPHPVHGELIGAVHAGQDGGQRLGVRGGEVFPGGGRGGVALAFRSDGAERAQGVRDLGPGSGGRRAQAQGRGQSQKRELFHNREVRLDLAATEPACNHY